MSETATTTTEAGAPKLLAEYRCDEGTRQLIGQRVNSAVHVSDVPAGDQGRVHLVERAIGCMAELDALIADYLETARRIGHCPMRGWL